MPLLLTLMPCATWAQTTPIPLSAESDAIRGTVIHRSLLGVIVETYDLGALAQSTSNGSGSDEATLASASKAVASIPIYSVTAVDDQTDACDTTTCDVAHGIVSMGQISLLNGLVTATTLQDTLTVTVDSVGLVHATNAASGALSGSGWTPPAKPINAGTQAPVSGTIPIPLLNLLGIPIGMTTATFTGTTTVNDVIQTTKADGTYDADFIVLHLVGSAPDGLGGFYQFDLRVAGPEYSGARPLYAFDDVELL